MLPAARPWRAIRRGIPWSTSTSRWTLCGGHAVDRRGRRAFMPGLMPRGVRDQVLATGVMSAVQYGLVINA
jgi:hypothetical protein